MGDLPGAEAVGFEDQTWRTVCVPHDWSIEGSFDRANAVAWNDFTKWVVWRKDGAQAYLPRGIGWYRLSFDFPALPADKEALLYFEGVYRESDAWLNGQALGHHASGYTSFFYDATRLLRPGRNVLAVRCDARLKEGWWYEACGIYRPAQLVVTDKLFVAPWGVWVATPEITAERAVARICTTVRNDHAEPRKAMVKTRIINAARAELGAVETAETVEAGKAREVTQEITVAFPRLWCPDEPYLYRAMTELSVEGTVVDAKETAFGIRTFHFDPELGFFLNGKPIKLWGAANHMDVASLGGALPPRVCYQAIRVLKGAGANFLRGAHNPRTSAELEAADRLGLCVVEETRYFDSSEFGQAALRDMILRDRNHPSVIVWSLGNEEEGKQGTPAGVAIAKDLIQVVRENDPYRATSIAQNRNFNQPCGFSDLFDVLGQNWRGQEEALEDHRLFPKRAVYTSEYNYDGTWDLYASWRWMAGASCWGGFEYYGEGSWPDKTWPGQIADLCHEPNAHYHRARAQWGRRPMVWMDNTWTGKPGQSVELQGFTNCEQVDVRVNGQFAKSIRKKQPISQLDQIWKLSQLDGGVTLLLAADGRALQTTDLKLVPADPSRVAQHWTVLPKPGDTIALKAGRAGVLNVYGESREDGAVVQLYCSSGEAANERWKIEPQEGGAVRLTALHSGKCLTAASPEGGLLQFAAATASDVDASASFVSTAWATLKITLPFEPNSTVRLEGLVGGKVVATHEIAALGTPTRLRLESAALTLRNDGADTALLRCGVADAHGTILRNADRKVRITVQGDGAFAGSGNACRELTKAGGTPVTSLETSTFRGLCQFAARAGQTPGEIVVRVEAEGLEAAQVTIPVTAESDPREVEVRPEGERLPTANAKEGFVLRSLDLSSESVAANEQVEARIDLANLSSAYPVEVTAALDGQIVHRERFSIALGGDRKIAVPLPKLYAEGNHGVVLTLLRNGKQIAQRSFTVLVRPTPLVLATEKLDVTPYVSPGGAVQVTATVRNLGSRRAQAVPVPVLLNGQQIAAPSASLLPGETGDIQATFPAPDGDRHEIRVADSTSLVTILKPFKPGAGMELVGAPASIPGKSTRALKFSGANEFIRIVPPVNLKETSFTIWMRCKLDRLDPESREAPLFSGGRPADQAGIRAGFYHDKVYFSVWGAPNLESAARVQAGQWVDLAFVLEATYMPKQTGPDAGDLQAAYWTARNRLYIDGKLQADGESKVYHGDLSQIGAFWSNAKTLNGVIEEVKVFTTALSPHQINQLQADPTQLREKIVLWLRLNE